MRLDKYIAAARILKSRSLVKTAADEDMVFLNGNKAKPASNVKMGDIIEVDTPRFYKKIRIVEFPSKNMRKTETVNLYQILEERKKELI
ncbi:MAG: RNA-binding S4 domain-containing protein [candidate division Zixibacteria bacterium]|nr:RNA-binding S4 domain-containing protein [candidate division Zixibacteria bacterium]